MDNQLTQALQPRGTFLNFGIFEAPAGTIASLIRPEDILAKNDELFPIGPNANAFAISEFSGSVFIASMKKNLYIGSTKGLDLTVVQSALLKQAAAVVIGGNKQSIELITSMNSGVVVPFYYPYLTPDVQLVFSLGFVEETKILFDWSTQKSS
ncbi:hypothetical protein A3A63_01015 [Candidatus Gottesmanbacteria bacterium RIFCSPLOWO2_01_FULL_46_9]|uniref:Uncharacterized protein n=1 Tax=Candidatus Gottesmanbacteria bacterium RIFCSPLOWO2_01_FULL_46_9 TaxID=1798394 RepID=A0A1F6B3I8_9BACT|nr:MAG: hypothetical protein A3A63_01015 [Candidatus Gottesmanbacteria bacterium RIFCSPLOWO2_01_FULL_46_9]